MVIALLGDSSSGKDRIKRDLVDCGYEPIVSYTTRNKREQEKNGEDYFFIDDKTFSYGVRCGLFAEYDEYSQNRKYGTYYKSYNDGKDKVVILTPNGLRQLKNNPIITDDIFAVYIKCPLGQRIKRYIDRIGDNKFTFDDKNEISARVERDYAMFLGIENDVDLVVDNYDTCTTAVSEILSKIVEKSIKSGVGNCQITTWK